MKTKRFTAPMLAAAAGFLLLAAGAYPSMAASAGPKQTLCGSIGCPDETFEHCFSGEVTINVGVVEITGNVTCYEPARGAPPAIE